MGNTLERGDGGPDDGLLDLAADPGVVLPGIVPGLDRVAHGHAARTGAGEDSAFGGLAPTSQAASFNRTKRR